MIAEPGAKRGIALFRRGEIQHLGLGHQRANPIDLRADGHGPLDAGYHLVEPFERHGPGRYRLPARGLLIEPRYVHVAVACQ
jgi:hypothetical protein